MKAFVIKRSNSYFAYDEYLEMQYWFQALSNATVYVNEEYAQEQINELNLKDCKIIEISMLEIEERQNAKVVEALEKVKECCNQTFYVGNGFSKEPTLKDIKYCIDKLIKEYGGKNE